MTRVTLDAATLAKLTEQSALFDENGRMVGAFLTPEEYFQFVCAEAQRDFDTTTTEQCRKEVAEQGAVPAEEVMRILRADLQAWRERK